MAEDIPDGYCQCGCGRRTSIVTQDDPKRGYKKGDYRRFINRHHIKNMQPNYKSNVHKKTCVICGKKFLPSKPTRQETQLTCSGKCRNAYIARKYADKQATTKRGRGEGKAYRKYHGRHEHRVVMEQILGRPLQPGEVVHHKDGNFLNNNPENLELFSSLAEHTAHHMRGKRACS